MVSDRARARPPAGGVPAACSAVTVLALGLIWALPGPVKFAGALILLGAFVWALVIAQRGGWAAIAPAIGLVLVFLILTGLTLAVFHVRSGAAITAAIGAFTLLAAWSGALYPASRVVEPGAPVKRPHPAAMAGAAIFAAAAVFAIHYSVVSATTDSEGASSLAVWAYPSGHRLLVGAQQPGGRGPASLRITVTQAGITVAVWNDVHLAPGQTWRAPPLTMTGSGPATVVARRGGVVVARFPAG